MFEAYKVAVELKLVNGVSAGLAGIITHMGVFDRSVHGANTRLGELHTQMQKIKSLGLIGAGMATLGAGGLALLKGPLHDATEWERVMARLQQKGLGDGQIADVKKFLRANDIYGVSLLERAKIFDEAQGSFRESGMSGSAALDAAKTMTPVLASYKMAMATLNDHSRGAAEGAFSQLNKIVELLGGLGDTKRATEIVGGVFKAVQSSGKMVSERDLRQFITMGGSAVSGLSLRTIFGGLEPQIGEFGGSAVGTGLNTAYRLLTGTQSKPSRLFVQEALKTGLWNQNNLVFNSQGGIKAYKGQPLNPEMSKLMREDTIGFAKALMNVYAKIGITSQQDRERENDILLGRTGAKIYNKIMLQLSTIESSLNSYDRSQTPDQVNNAQKDSIIQKSIELQKQWNDATLNFGLVAMPVAIKGIDLITAGLKTFTDYAKENPGMVRAMTLGFIGLSGALAFGGTVMVLSSAFKGLSLALEFASAGGLTRLAPLIGAIGTRLTQLGQIGLAFGAGWAVGSILYETVIAGTKFSNWLGSFIAHIMAPFSSEAAGAVKQNSGKAWYQFGPKSNIDSSAAATMAAWDQAGRGKSTASSHSPYIAPAAKQPVQIVNNTYRDGKLISQNVVEKMVNQMMRPAAGLSSFDPRAGFVSPSQAY